MLRKQSVHETIQKEAGRTRTATPTWKQALQNVGPHRVQMGKGGGVGASNPLCGNKRANASTMAHGFTTTNLWLACQEGWPRREIAAICELNSSLRSTALGTGRAMTIGTKGDERRRTPGREIGLK